MRFLERGVVLCAILVLLLFIGCGGGGGRVEPHQISGRVVDQNEDGIPNIEIVVTGGTSLSTDTGADGRWQAPVRGTVTVTPRSTVYTFEPEDQDVTGPASNVDFVGTPIGVEPTIATIAPVAAVEVALGTSEAAARDQLAAQTTITDSVGGEHEVDLHWTIDGYDGQVPGDYTATGTFDLPAGVAQTDPPRDLSVTTTVTVLGAELPQLVEIRPVAHVNVGFGALEEEALAQLASHTTIIDSDDVEHEVALEWTIDGYNGEVAGVYNATGTFDLPAGVRQSVPMTPLEVTATVTVHAQAQRVIARVLPVNNVEVPYGTDRAEALDQLADSTRIVDNFGDEHRVDVQWSIPDYDSSVRDGYEAVGTFELPAGVNPSAEPLEVIAEVRVVERELIITARDQPKRVGEELEFSGDEFDTVGLVFDDRVDSVDLESPGSAAAAESGLEYPIIISNAQGVGLENYNITYEPGWLEVFDRQPPVIHAWPSPQIVYGETLGEATLDDGDADVEGAFAFANPDLLPTDAGSWRATVLFVPADQEVYAELSRRIDVEVSPRPLQVTADASQSRVYGDDDPGLDYHISSGELIGTDSLTGVLRGPGPGATVGVYPIQQGTLTAGPNYELTFIGADFTVERRELTVSVSGSKVFGAEDDAYTITYDGFAYDDNEAVVTGELNINREPGEGVDTYNILDADGLVAHNYEITYDVGTFVIEPQTVIVTANPQTKVYGDDDPELDFDIEGAERDEVTGSLGREEGENVGRYRINQGTLELPDNYSVEFAEADLTIEPRPITVTIADADKTYGQPDPEWEYNVTEGFLVDGDAFTGQPRREDSVNRNAGTYRIEQGSLSPGENYTMTVIPGEFVIEPAVLTIRGREVFKQVGTEYRVRGVEFTVTGLQHGDRITITEFDSEGLSDDAPEGRYPLLPGEAVVATLEGQMTTYVFSEMGMLAVGQERGEALGGVRSLDDAPPPADGEVPSQNYLGDIVPGWMEVNWMQDLSEGEDLGASAIEYGQRLSEVVVSGSVYVANSNQLVAGQWQLDEDDQVPNRNEHDGSYEADFRFIPDDLFLYNELVTKILVPINPRTIVVTPQADQSKMYGRGDPDLAYTHEALVGDDRLRGALSRDPGENVGTYQIGLGTLTAGNDYELVLADTPVFFTIDPRPLTVRGGTHTKVYDDDDPEFDWEIREGRLIGADSLEGVLARQDGEDVGSYDIHQGSLTGGDNYALTFEPGRLTITRRPVTVTADAVEKTYGDDDPDLTYVVRDSEGQALPDIQLTGTLTRAAGDNAGIRPISRGTLTDANNPNYQITFVGNALTIHRRSLTITALDQTKTVGQLYVIPGDQFEPEGLVDGDRVISVVLTSDGTTREAEIGEYAIVASGAIGSRLSLNYDMEYVDGTLTVLDKVEPTIVDMPTASPITYGQLLRFSQLTEGRATDGDRDVPGEFAFVNPNERLEAGERETTVLFTPDDAGRYQTVELTIPVAVAQREITVTAQGRTKRYGVSDEWFRFPPVSGPVFRYTVTPGLVSGDRLTGELEREPGEDEGVYPIRLGTLGNPNYNITFVGADLRIIPRQLDISAGNPEKVYGDPDPELIYRILSGSIPDLDWVVPPDIVLYRDDGEDVGDYDIHLDQSAISSNWDVRLLPRIGSPTFTITERDVYVTADNKQKQYGDDDPQLTYTATGLLPGDAITVELEREIGENVGEYVIDATHLDGGQNYHIAEFTPGVLEITPRSLRVGIDGKTKVYGEPDPALTYDLVGELVGDDQLDVELDRERGENVGIYDIFVASNLDADPNYSVTVTPGVLEITPYTLQITADSHEKDEGEPDPEFTYAITDGEFQWDDTAANTLSGTLSRQLGEVAGNYQIQQGTLTAGDNYTIDFVTGVLTIHAVAATTTVSGTVTLEAGSGNVTEVDVYLAQNGVPILGPIHPAADGTYSFAGVSDGTSYTIEASLAGYVTATSPSFVVADAQPVTGVDLTLAQTPLSAFDVTVSVDDSLPNLRVFDVIVGSVTDQTETTAFSVVGIALDGGVETELESDKVLVSAGTRARQMTINRYVELRVYDSSAADATLLGWATIDASDTSIAELPLTRP